MFRIPDFYVEPVDFDRACKLIADRANGDLLEGMKDIDGMWQLHCEGEMGYEDDDQFFENWVYEVNAYNCVFENMAKLFEEA